MGPVRAVPAASSTRMTRAACSWARSTRSRTWPRIGRPSCTCTTAVQSFRYRTVPLDPSLLTVSRVQRLSCRDFQYDEQELMYCDTEIDLVVRACLPRASVAVTVS